MRRDVLLLCSFYLLPLGAHADDSGLSAKDIKTLFFGHDDRKAVNRPGESGGTRLASWKPPAAICVRRRSSLRIWRL